MGSRFTPCNENFELRFLFSSSVADLIIGENGTNIKRLHKQFCAIINVSDSHTCERILTLSGFNVASVHSMLEDILKQVHRISGAEESCMNWLLDETQVDYLTSHDIKQLNNVLEVSCTMIDVYFLNCPLSSERIIRIRGQPTNVSQCICNLLDLLSGCSIKKCHQPYNANNAKETSAADYGGFRKENANILNQNNNTSQQQVRTYQDGQDADRLHKRAKYSEQVRQAKESNLTNQLPLTFPKHQRCDPTIGQVCKDFTLPLHLLPLIMGDKGSRMKQISDESTADVELKMIEEKAECCIAIKGTSEAVENAQFLMKLCIQMMGRKVE